MPFRIIAFLAGAVAFAQAPSVKQLMLDLIHPACNEILLRVNRGGPADEKEWAAVRHAAVSLAAAGQALSPANSNAEWAKDAGLFTEAGTAAYQAALAKDTKALAAAAESLDASCTACHKQYRPDVFPRQGGSQ